MKKPCAICGKLINPSGKRAWWEYGTNNHWCNDCYIKWKSGLLIEVKPNAKIVQVGLEDNGALQSNP